MNSVRPRAFQAIAFLLTRKIRGPGLFVQKGICEESCEENIVYFAHKAMWIVIWLAVLPSLVFLQNNDPRLYSAFKKVTLTNVEAAPTVEGEALKIELNLVVFHAGKISEVEQTFQVDSNLAISW